MKLKDFVLKAIGLVVPLGIAILAAGTANAAAVEGTWRALNGSEITIEPCPEGFCGTLSYIVIPKSQADLCRSMPKETFAPLILDYNNANRSLQTRPLLGVRIITLRPTNEPEGYTATIYNAEDGKYYDVLAWILNGKTFRLGGGCVGTWCAVTQDWPRVAEREIVPDFTCDGGI